MANTFITGSAGASGGSANIFNYNTSTLVQAGDLLFVMLICDSAQDVDTPPGWTPGDNIVFGAKRFRNYRRTATSSETFQTFSTTGAVPTQGSGAWIAYRAPQGEDTSGIQGLASTLNPVAPSVSPVSSHGGMNTLVCWFLGFFPGGGSTLSTPPSMVSRFVDSGSQIFRIADQEISGTGASGTRTSTATGTGTDGPAVGWAFLLKGEMAGGWSVGSISIK